MNKKIKTPQDMIAGTIHKTKDFGELKIIKYENSKAVHIEFISTGCRKMAQSDHIRKGEVKDVLSPSVFGVGFIGIGDFASKSKPHKTWESMVRRCYNKNIKENPTYKDCTVTPEWHNFQNFAKWYDDNYPNDGGKYDLDKDLLIVNNNIYSPVSCIFIPSWLNSFTINCEASRGDLPVGVNYFKRDGTFQSGCSHDGRNIYLGRFSTPEAVHLAWRKYKLALALDKKPKMDMIDSRIYPNVVQIITEAR